MWYKTFLPRLHEMIGPERYIEIGIRHGYSLSISPKAKKIAIDPTYAESDMHFDVPNTIFYKMTSDDYFLNCRVQDDFSQPFDLGYIDGFHNFEYALRDFINLEKLSSKRSVIIIDDVLPRTPIEATRNPTGGNWAGDVWKLLPCLLNFRPDIAQHMILAKVEPTGCLIIIKPDSLSRVLVERYDEIIEMYLNPQYPNFPDVRTLELAVSSEDALTILGDKLRVK